MPHPLLSPNELLLNVERLLLCLLLLYVLYLLYQQHRVRLRRLWRRSKDRLPRPWKPQSRRDCACCQTGITLLPLPNPNAVVPWSQRKSNCGRKETVDTNGYVCPHPDCDYCGITDDWSAMAGSTRLTPFANCAVRPAAKPSPCARARSCTTSKPTPNRLR